MKKYLCLFLAVILMFGITACSQNNSVEFESSEEVSSSEDVSESDTDEDEVTKDEITKDEITEDETTEDDNSLENSDDAESDTIGHWTEEDYEEQTGIEIDDTVDVDLTVLSATMVYAEVYNMLCYPDDYEGKLIKMTGTFLTYEDPETGILYYAVFVQDAAACCVQGFEFELLDEDSACPEYGAEVTVIGEFVTYYEYGIRYAQLSEAYFA